MLRLGIIGTNFITDWMLGAKELVPQIVPTAVYSRKEETGRAFAGKYGIGLVYTDLEAFASSDAFDAVYVASPNYMHYPQSLLMLWHGKHVLCEKPATSSAWEVKELIRVAREKGLIYLEAMRLVFDDALPIMKDAISQVGRLRRATFDFCQYSSRYDRIRGGETGVNAFTPELSNAAIMDMGCYCVHALVSMFGKPRRVLAQSYFLPGGFEAGGTVLLGYDGFLGEAVYSKVAQQTAPSTLLCEDGAIFMDNINRTQRIWLQKRGSTEQIDLPYRPKLPINMFCELREFLQAVETGIQPEKRNQDSVWTMEILNEVRRQNGIRFPADK